MPLNDTQLYAMKRLAVTHCTNSPVDRAVQAIMLRSCKLGDDGMDHAVVRSIIVNARFAHIDNLSVTQRRWQARTSRPQRAKHHDSLTIREKYVRCDGKDHSAKSTLGAELWAYRRFVAGGR